MIEDAIAIDSRARRTPFTLWPPYHARRRRLARRLIVGCPGVHVSRRQETLPRAGSPVKITLRVVTTEGGEVGRSGGVFDTFGYYAAVDAVCQFDDGPDNAAISRVAGDVTHEDLVDLDFVDGDAAQLQQPGRSGAEIVDGDIDTGGTQRRNSRDRGVAVVSEGRFGDLKGQLAWLRTVLGQQAEDLPGEGPRFEIARRDVHRHLPKHPASLPFLLIGQRAAQDPLGERVDQRRGLGRGNELVRRQQSPRRVVPADQCLDAGRVPVGEVDLRLVVQHEFVVVERSRQFGLNFVPTGQRRRDAGLPYGRAVDTPLGLIHRGVGVDH